MSDPSELLNKNVKATQVLFRIVARAYIVTLEVVKMNEEMVTTITRLRRTLVESDRKESSVTAYSVVGLSCRLILLICGIWS